MAERNIKIIVEYEGTACAGWQIQQNQSTVQGKLVAAIQKVTGEKVNLLGAGRTDSGVHALAQVANFRIDHRLEPERYRDAINYYLPADIRVKASEEVPLSFHARFDATFRRYRYLVSREKSAIYRNQRYHCPFELDMGQLRAAAAEVEGEHDFKPFCVVASRQESNICRVFRSRWVQMGPLLVYEVRANRFLHSMVRSLVGAMLNLAAVDPDRNSLNLTLESFRNIIHATTDERVAFTAPAHGLYLVAVGYQAKDSANEILH
ncbi:MAG: tRNA pseudouridine(38-40) synthase TruA [bacterium]|nr:tRNA pseudouridine(38-40) synthase TruA [bacterium]